MPRKYQTHCRICQAPRVEGKMPFCVQHNAEYRAAEHQRRIGNPVELPAKMPKASPEELRRRDEERKRKPPVVEVEADEQRAAWVDAVMARYRR